MNVKQYDAWIVQVENQYLVAVAYKDTNMCRWSTSPFDAAQIEDINAALTIAKAAGGHIVRFNPITGNVS